MVRSQTPLTCFGEHGKEIPFPLLFWFGQPLSQIIKSKYNHKWDQNKFKYLGVTICQDFNMLYQYNFGALESQIKQDLQKWTSTPLTITGRIDIMKTNVLPRLIFVFQNLPIHTPKKNL